MEHIYAQIDENNVCFAVSRFAGEIVQDNLVALSKYDTTILGKKYVAGEWLSTKTDDTTLTEEHETILESLQ